MSQDRELMKLMGWFKSKPLEYVMFNWPWHLHFTEGGCGMVELQEPYASRFPQCKYGPDVWACAFLDQLGEEIEKRGFDGRKAVAPIRFTTSSGHGIGKSTLVSWLIMFVLDTRPFAMGVVTANTSDQLRTKTWAELAKWHHISKTRNYWVYSNSRGSMSLYRQGEKAISQKWRADAMTARAENSEAFQGLHAANSTPFYIFDEASGIEDSIWEARFGGATDGEPMSFDFGNPTRKSGYFYENCAGMYKHRYITRQIDSRSVAITNKELMEEWRQDWGEDNDLFKVKVRGMFPATGNVQFIGSDLVTEAMRRPAIYSRNEPLIIGVDVARMGSNNTVIYPRIGDDARSFPYKQFNGLDGYAVADKVIETINEFKAIGLTCSGLFIDGGGLGSGPVDILRRLGWNPIDVLFGRTASDARYRYWGDMMWGRLRDALGQRLALPLDPDLKQQLTQREYGLMDSGKINLESKKVMKERLGEKGSSPDVADALALTFAKDIGASIDLSRAQAPRVISEWNPFDESAWAR